LTSGNGNSFGGTNIQVDRQSVNDGAVGVKVQVGGRLVGPRSTLLDPGPLFGRAEDLSFIAETLKDTDSGARIILSGEPGVGKTHLANAYGANNRARYPGGMFFIAFNADPGLGLAKLISPLAEETIADRATRMLASTRDATLLIYDNVPSEDDLKAWLPPAGLPVHLLVTTTSSDWPRRHTVRRILPLDDTDALEMVEGVAGHDTANLYGAVLVNRARGIAVRLKADCSYAEHELRHGRQPAFETKLDDTTASSFAQALALLPPDGQFVLRVATLFNSANIPEDELVHLLASQAWDQKRILHALDASVDRTLLTRASGLLRMHELVAKFIRTREVPTIPEGILAEHRNAFIATAEAFASAPGRVHLRERLARYPSLVADWEGMGLPIDLWNCVRITKALAESGRFREALEWADRSVAAASKGDRLPSAAPSSILGGSLHMAGCCLMLLGKYVEADLWFERAVVAHESGDQHGVVDHIVVAGSLREKGNCLSMRGDYAHAQIALERAVTEAKQGDGHGRLDPAEAGKSMHLLGYCLSKQGAYGPAMVWCERAVESKEKGDAQGRADYTDLSSSLNMVGHCLWHLGKPEDAEPWFRRALAASKRGDVHGRVDHVIIAGNLHQIGLCLSTLRRYGEAKPWFEQAIEAAERGDVYGRADYSFVSKSAREVGVCLSRLGQLDDAIPWFERAIAECEKGGRDGRVDQTMVGNSAHEAGACLARLGRLSDAARLHERATAAFSQGDENGRVNHSILGMSSREVGLCLSTLGRHFEARPWYERAVGACEKVDTDGHVRKEYLLASLRSLVECLRRLGLREEAQRRSAQAAALLDGR